jgi:hypothetical protein
LKKRIALLQSNYIPWIGYFDIVNNVDVFVIYDSVQYTKNDWRNRNQIKTANGPIWLTIPISSSKSSNQSIRDVKIASPQWARKHWKSIELAMGKCPHFELYRDDWFGWYEIAEELDQLHEVNVLFFRGVCKQLGIKSKILFDWDVSYSGQTPSEKIASICESLNADIYLTGPSGLNYMNIDVFAEKGIGVDVIRYDYQPYKQLHGGHIAKLSALDLLANVGPDAAMRLVGLTSRI